MSGPPFHLVRCAFVPPCPLSCAAMHCSGSRAVCHVLPVWQCVCMHVMVCNPHSLMMDTTFDDAFLTVVFGLCSFLSTF